MIEIIFSVLTVITVVLWTMRVWTGRRQPVRPTAPTEGRWIKPTRWHD